MKKLFLSLVAIAATSLAGFADTSLAQAYSELSGISGMTEKKVSNVQVDGKASISNIKTSKASVSGENAENYRAKFIYTMESLPVRKMVMGANNQRELAAVYAEPIGGGKYNVLIVKGDALGGSFSASFGQTTKAGVNAIRNSSVTMDAEGLAIMTTPESGEATFITMAD
ncbi:MAG: hypothetical protein K1W02_02225 [Muribaculaceae bacterium]|jgi:hypothetical protein